MLEEKNFILFCSLSECAVVDHSERDEEMSSDSAVATSDSDEDFTPDKKTTPKRKNKQVAKLQKPQNKKVSINIIVKNFHKMARPQ